MASTEEATVEFWRDVELGHIHVPIALLTPAKRNPRRGNVREVAESLREFGQHRPVVVQRGSGEIIVGNHLYHAALLLGWGSLDAFVVDDDDKQALRRAVADNAVGDQAGWDKEELASVMQEIGAVPGYGESDIAKLLESLAGKTGLGDEATYPVMAVLNEQYETVLIVAKNAVDWAWLETKLQLRKERSYKSTQVAVCHVLSVGRLQEVLEGRPMNEEAPEGMSRENMAPYKEKKK
jgi:hypothetical protein